MKVLITGSSGMLGSECREVLPQEFDVVSRDRKEMDIVSWDRVIDGLHHFDPDVVVNCAGVTEGESRGMDAYLLGKANVEGPRNLAQGCARYDIRLVHISCACVFDGQKPLPQPYFEDDTLAPLSDFGRSKLESEAAVRGNSPDYIIVRTAWLYGQHGDNYLKTILRNALRRKPLPMKVSTSHYGAPTWTMRVAEQIRILIKTGGRGTYHVTAEGHCSEYEYVSLVIEALNLKMPLIPCSAEDEPEGQKRPLNGILDNRLAKKQSVNVMLDWKEDLLRFLENHGERMIKQARSQKD